MSKTGNVSEAKAEQGWSISERKDEEGEARSDGKTRTDVNTDDGGQVCKSERSPFSKRSHDTRRLQRSSTHEGEGPGWQ
jgi:hypothetical protein